MKKTERNRGRIRGILLLVALVSAALAAPTAFAQDGPEAPPREQIATALAALPEETEDEAIKAAKANYQEALKALDRRDAARQAEQAFKDLVTQAPARLEAIRAELAQPIEFTPPEVAPEATTEKLTSQLQVVQAELEAAKTQAAELDAEVGKRDERRAAIPGEIAGARQRLQNLTDTIASLPPPSATESPREAAQRAALLTERDALRAEIARLEAELASIEARRELLPVRRDLAKRRVDLAQQRFTAWEAIVKTRREREQRAAEREAERLRQEAARRHPVLQSFAERNKALTKETGDVQNAIASSRGTTQDVDAQITDLERRYANVTRRLELSGLDRATGLFLRSQYERLKSRSELERLIRSTELRLSEVSLQKLEREENKAELGDTASEIAENLIADVNAEPPQVATEEIAEFAQTLASARRDELSKLITELGKLEDQLSELLGKQRSLLTTTDNFRDYIEERILWTRSVEGGVLPNLQNASDAALWLFASRDWIAAVRASLDAMLGRAALWLLGLIAVLFTFAVRRQALHRLDHFGENVSRYKTDSFAYTLRATYVTIVAAAPWPALFLFIGLALRAPTGQADVAHVAGFALIQTALTFYLIQLLRTGLRPGGLGDAHFRWPDASIALVRRHLIWFAPIFVPTVFIVIAMEASGSTARNDSLGRLAFFVMMVASLIFIRFVLHPKGALMSSYLSADEGSWGNRLRFIWFPALLAIPAALLLASLTGYHYTAVQFERKIEYTLIILVIVGTLNAILMRWLFIARRRLAIEDAKRRREAAMETKGDQPATEAPPIDENKLDLPAISAATQKLFRSAAVAGLIIGLFVVWGDTLPALRMLDRVQIYPAIRVLDESIEDTVTAVLPANAAQAASQSAEQGAGESQTSGGSMGLNPTGLPSTDTSASSDASGLPASLTLADVGLSIIILIATVVAFRNLPALIEIIVLRRLPLDASARYALAAVLRYTIAIVGIALAFSALGLSWSKVQWLAAALTFGLAFGLQEIFANFVSGLIILGERPVRIGDTVTVGDVTGTVSRIRMRATTITDWDRKELIIPNKTFITERVINWTLSDPVLRVIIPVGVSYGSDVKLVEKTLLKVARAHKFVLKDPAPFVLFTSFADSTLNFELRVFIPHIEHLVAVKHEMHMNITKAFRDENIEIAFPQRDLHIRDIKGLESFVAKREDLPREEVQPAGG